ncbi:hypothetical protein H8D85_00945 [bacterium]|nr:hypothetical protein [bacterium]
MSTLTVNTGLFPEFPASSFIFLISTVLTPSIKILSTVFSFTKLCIKLRQILEFAATLVILPLISSDVFSLIIMEPVELAAIPEESFPAPSRPFPKGSESIVYQLNETGILPFMSPLIQESPSFDKNEPSPPRVQSEESFPAIVILIVALLIEA